MPTDRNRAELWAENIEFYKELVTKYYFQQELMIVLFPKLDEAGFFEKYYPSNSHESLGLSTEREFSLRRTKPMGYLTYLPKENSFEVTYQQGQGNIVNEENVGPLVLPKVLTKIDAWLSADIVSSR
jgi:hypothetical protein